MAFDFNRLTDKQLLRLREVGYDPNNLTDDELLALKESQDEVSDGGAGLGLGISGIQLGAATVAQALGFDETAQSWAADAEEDRESIQRRWQPDVPSYEDVESIGDAYEYAKEGFLTSFLPTATALGVGAGVGILTKNPFLAYGAGVAAGAPSLIGSQAQRQMDELGLEFKDIDNAMAIGVGVGNATLDATIGRLFGIFGRSAPKVLSEYAEKAVKGRFARRSKDFGKAVGAGVGTEATTETLQTAIEILSVNPDKFMEMPKEVRSELINSAILGGVLGGTLSGAANMVGLGPTAPESQALRDLKNHMDEINQRNEEAQRIINQGEEAPQLPPPLVGPEMPREGMALQLAPGAVPQEDVSAAIQPSIEGAPDRPASPRLEEELELDLANRKLQEAVANQDIETQAELENSIIPDLQARIEQQKIAARVPDVQEAGRQAQEEFGLGLPSPEQEVVSVPVQRRARIVDQEMKSRNRMDKKPAASTAGRPVGDQAGLSSVENETREQQVGVTQTDLFEEAAPDSKAPVVDDINTDASRLFFKYPELNEVYTQLVAREEANPASPATRASKNQVRKILKDEDPDLVSRLLDDTPSNKQEVLRLAQLAPEAEAQTARREASEFIDETTPEFSTPDQVRAHNQQIERVRKLLKKVLRKYGLKDVDIQFSDTRDARGEGHAQIAGGRFIISLAHRYIKPNMTDQEVFRILANVMNHEVIHALRYMGILKEAEFQKLVQAAKNQRFIDDNNNERLFSFFDRAQALYSDPKLIKDGGYDNLQDMQEEEAVAELFRAYADPKREAKMLKNQAKTLGDVFKKILRFFKLLGASVEQEAADIFDNIRAGNIGKRERNPISAIAENTRESRLVTMQDPLPNIPVQKDESGARFQIIERKSGMDGKPLKFRRMLDVTEESNPLLVKLGRDVWKQYQDLASYQRGEPEDAMTDVQARISGFESYEDLRLRKPKKLMGREGVPSGENTFGTVIEHTNDIIHRFNEREFGIGNATEKAERMLRYMEGYGPYETYEEVVAKEFSDRANYYGMTSAEYANWITPTLNKYIAAHQRIPVYNELQRLANDAAIAVGQLDFARARRNLEKFLAASRDMDAFYDEMQPQIVKDGKAVNLKTVFVDKAAERAGIDDREGTTRFSTLTPDPEWLDASVIPEQVYHGTLANFGAFSRQFRDIGFHFGSNTQAFDRLEALSSERANRYANSGVPEALFPRYIKSRLQIRRPLTIPNDAYEWRDPQSVIDVIRGGAYDYVNGNKDVRDDVLNKISGLKTIDEVRAALKEMGYDSIIYMNMVEGNTSKLFDTSNVSYIVFEPSQIFVEESQNLNFSDIPALENTPDFREANPETTFTGNDLRIAKVEGDIDAVNSTLRDEALLRRLTDAGVMNSVEATGGFVEGMRVNLMSVVKNLPTILWKATNKNVTRSDTEWMLDALSDIQMLPTEATLSANDFATAEGIYSAIEEIINELPKIVPSESTFIKGIEQAKEIPQLGVQEKIIERMSRLAPPRVMKNGEIVGSPPGARTEADRNKLVRKLSKIMNEPFAMVEQSKDWYERSGKAIRDITRGDPELMDQVARLMALYSQGNSVGGNTTATVKSMAQIVRGEESIQAGRFPETTAKLIPDLLAAPEFDQSQKGVSDKIENFYRNLIDAARGTDTFDQASTQDKWMMRLFGYKVADDEDSGGSSQLSPTQYAYARDLIRRVGESWERKTGEKLLPRQVQAVLWTWKKNNDAYEETKNKDKFQPTMLDFSDYLIRATANVTFEARPSTKLPMLSWIHDSQREVQSLLNNKVYDVLHDADGNDRIMNLLGGSQLYHSEKAVGGYESRVVPNVIGKIVLEKDGDKDYIYDVANKYASILGYVLKQDAVPWFRPDPTAGGVYASKGFKVTFSEPLTDSQEGDMINTLNQLDEWAGFTKIGDSYYFVNFRDVDAKGRELFGNDYDPDILTKKQKDMTPDEKARKRQLVSAFTKTDKQYEKMLKSVMAEVPVESYDMGDFRAASNYIYNDWTENPNGETFQKIYGEQGFGDLQSAVDSIANDINEVFGQFDAERGQYESRSSQEVGRPDEGPRRESRLYPLSNDAPLYRSGRAGPDRGRVKLRAVHYSRATDLPELDSMFFGQGVRGDESDRIDPNTEIAQRVYLYVQQSDQLPRGENVGNLNRMDNGYVVDLDNIYNPIPSEGGDPFLITRAKEQTGLPFDNPQTQNAFEQLVIDEGYDGWVNYIFRPSPAVVLLGSHKVPAKQILKGGDTGFSAIADSDGPIRYSTLSPSNNFEAFADRVLGGTEETGPFTKLFRFLVGAAPNEPLGQALARNFANRFLPAYVLDSKAYGKIIDNAKSVGRAMELSQQVVGRMQAMMEFGPVQLDKDGTVTQVEDDKVGGLNQIFAPLFEGLNKQDSKKAQRLFYSYAIARREIELRKKGRKGILSENMSELQRQVNEAPQLYKDIFENFQRFNDYTIKLGVDSGLITKDMAGNLRDMAYVPFYREFGTDQEQDFGNALPIQASNSLNNPEAFDKRLRGSKEKIGEDLLQNVFSNQQQILSAALKNIAMQRTAEAIEVLNRKGDMGIGYRVKTSESGDQIARFRVNGQEVAYKIEDGAMWKAIAGLTPPQKSAFIQAAEFFANMLRFGVTNMPGFMLANIWRGKIDAFVKLGINPIRFDQTINGMRNVLNNDDTAMKIKLMTGFGGYGYGADAGDFSAVALRQMRTKGKVFGSGDWKDSLLNVKRNLERFGEATEMAERVVIFNKMIADGYSEREAAFQAMNLINYGRRGAGGGVLGSALVYGLIPSIPFLNARIQGLYRLGEFSQTPSDKQSVFRQIMVRGLMLSAFSVALYMTGVDDEVWDEETVENKINYDYLFIGDGVAVKFPRAFEIGSIFGTLPVMLLETIRQEDGSDMAKAVGMTLFNTFAFNPIPQGVMPAIEVASGHDFFRGAPIEGQALAGKLTEERYYDSTPELYKWLSKNGGSLVGLSPLEIQQLMEGYLAGVATLFTGIGDTTLQAIGAVPDKPNGVFGNPYVSDLARVAGLNRFIAVDGEKATRFTRQFYELKRTIDQYNRSVQDASAKGDTERVKELLAEKGMAMSFRKAFNSVAQQLSQINLAIQQVMVSGTMSPAEKTKRLRELRETKNELSKRYVKMATSSGYFD